jgi:hypothetical protein
MNEQEFGDIPVPELVVIFLEGCADERTLPRNHGAFFRSCFAGADTPDELAKLDRHLVDQWGAASSREFKPTPSMLLAQD